MAKFYDYDEYDGYFDDEEYEIDDDEGYSEYTDIPFEDMYRLYNRQGKESNKKNEYIKDKKIDKRIQYDLLDDDSYDNLNGDLDNDLDNNDLNNDNNGIEDDIIKEVVNDKICDNYEHDIKIYVPKFLLNKDCCSAHALSAYCLLQYFVSAFRSEDLYLSYKQVIYTVINKIYYEKESLFLKWFKLGIEELNNLNIIEVIEDTKKAIHVQCKTTKKILNDNEFSANIEDKSFVVIYFKEIQKIFKEFSGIKKYTILKYFIVLMATLNGNLIVRLDDKDAGKKGVVGNLSLSELSEYAQCSEKSVVYYNKLLELLKLIHIYRGNTIVMREEDTKTMIVMHNIYGRYINKNYVDAFGVQNEKMQRNKAQKKIVRNMDELNYKRKYTQQYNYLVEHPDDNCYTEEQIKNIYNFIAAKNSSFIKQYYVTGDKRYLGRVHDLSIFRKYNFIIEGLKEQKKKRDEILLGLYPNKVNNVQKNENNPQARFKAKLGIDIGREATDEDFKILENKSII